MKLPQWRRRSVRVVAYDIHEKESGDVILYPGDTLSLNTGDSHEQAVEIKMEKDGTLRVRLLLPFWNPSDDLLRWAATRKRHVHPMTPEQMGSPLRAKKG